MLSSPPHVLRRIRSLLVAAVPHSEPPFSAIAFIRHSITNKSQQEGFTHDSVRQLTDTGRQKCMDARNGWYKEHILMHPRVAVSSAAQRCLDTCSIITNDDPKPIIVPYLYDGVFEPGPCDLFRQLSYKPLSDYFNAPGGEEAYRSYAERAMFDVVGALQSQSCMSNSKSSILCIFGHAIHLPAMCLITAEAIEIDRSHRDQIINFNQQEAECILLTKSNVKLLK